MSGKWVNQGENRVLNQLFEATAVDETLELRLYCDPVTEPPEDVVFADITEPAGNGYAAIILTRATDWTVVTDTATGVQKTFTATGSWGNVYGYFICVPTTHEIMAVEQFSDGPYNITVSGQTIKVTPVIKCA
jgi:hypothetical protein